MALGHVGAFLMAILIGGILGWAAPVGVALARRGAFSLEPIREAAVAGMFLSLGLSLPLSLVLLILGSKQRGPATWWGWSVAGFVLGLLPAAALGWLKHSAGL